MVLSRNSTPSLTPSKPILSECKCTSRPMQLPQLNKVPILLSSIGVSTYSLLSNLVAPDSPGTKPCAEISNVLRKRYEPKRAVIVERFHFHKHDQAVGESMADFDAVHITTLCNFGENLEETLRCVVYVTILFNGNCYRKLTRRLWKFLQPDKNRKAFKLPESSIKKFCSCSVNQQSCYRSRRTNHTATDCKFKDIECHKCGKRGTLLQPAGQRCNHKDTHHSRSRRGATTKCTGFRTTHQPRTLMRAVVSNIYHLHELVPHFCHPMLQVLVNNKIGGYGSSSQHYLQSHWESQVLSPQIVQ